MNHHRAPQFKRLAAALAAIVLSLSAVTGIYGNLTDNPVTLPADTPITQSDSTAYLPNPQNIPDYTGAPSIELSNSSNLDPNDAPAAIQLSDLDTLGRCGSVSLTVNTGTMPKAGEKRGSIGMVKPTGWHTVRDDSLDGKYLYNRCHLAAWCLSSLNAEPRNLITGTRYMNVEGMLPYETKVADFVESTGTPVYYKVTPDFHADELVARGVRIQALSLTDNGQGINFDVYCYNVQPGYTIDYATGNAVKQAE